MSAQLRPIDPVCVDREVGTRTRKHSSIAEGPTAVGGPPVMNWTAGPSDKLFIIITSTVGLSKTEFEFRIRERRRATARRRFSAWMSRALRVRAHFFVIVSGVSCAGRRLACAPTVGIAKRFADIKSTFPLFRRRDVLRSLSAEGGGKILPQTRTRASRRKSIRLSRSSTSQRLS